MSQMSSLKVRSPSSVTEDRAKLEHREAQLLQAAQLMTEAAQHLREHPEQPIPAMVALTAKAVVIRKELGRD